MTVRGRKLRVIIIGLISRKGIQRVALAFVDNTNLYTNRIKCQERIQKAAEIYTKLFKATGGLISREKKYCYG